MDNINSKIKTKQNPATNGQSCCVGLWDNYGFAETRKKNEHGIIFMNNHFFVH